MGGPTSGPLPAGGGSELERIRRMVSAYFPVYETRLGHRSLLLAVHVDRTDLEARFDRMRQEMWAAGYIPILRQQSGEQYVEVIPRPRPGTRRQWVNLVLLAATVVTTTFAGALIWLTYVGGTDLAGTDFVNGALYFSIPVLTILGLHELAHYFMARRRHIDASLPYFIPLPPPFLFGTFGAFISIREPFPDRKAMFDIGAAGPLAGFAASIPVALAGLYLSAHAPVLPATYCGPTILGVSYGNIEIGVPLFWQLLSYFFPPSLVSLSPLALAGWVGIFVTAINLLPAGQLDGGHVFRALAGERSRFVSYAAVLLLFALGIFYTGWLFFGILILLLGMRHPPPLNDLSRLGTKRYLVGALVVAILIGGFVIVPLATPLGQMQLDVGAVHYPGATAGGPVTADVQYAIVNQDPVSHGYTFSGQVVNVSQRVGNTTVYLGGAALRDWEANASWTFALPGAANVTVYGASATFPGGAYVTVDGSATVQLSFAFFDSGSATSVTLDLSSDQFCATAGGGSATNSVVLIPP